MRGSKSTTREKDERERIKREKRELKQAKRQTQRENSLELSKTAVRPL